MAPANPSSVLLCSPGNRLAFQTALALQEAELLSHFVTSFYFREASLLTKGIRLAPGAMFKKLENELRRRYLPGINESLVRTAGFTELSFILAKRLGLPASLSKPLAERRIQIHAKHFRTVLLKTQPAAVICPDGWAYDLFSSIGKGETLKILDQNIGHIISGAEIMKTEIELHPELADSISPWTEEFVEKCRQEALMADALLVSSDYATNSLTAIGVAPERIHKVEYAADPSRFTPKPREAETTVRALFVGILSQRKGIKYLLEAVKKLNHPQLRLQMTGTAIGSGEGLKPFREFFDHTPNVAHHNIHKVYQDADFFVMPTLHESGVLAIHEALASGLPVITTPNAGSIVRDGKEGFLVPIRNVEALAEKIELLTNNQELRNEMSKAARARAEEFSWTRYRKGIAATVDNLLKNR